jgi:PAS domain S-box-containing protein
MDAQQGSRAMAPLGLNVEPFLDASPDAVLAVDARGRIVYASPRVQQVFGWSPNELRGQPIELLVPSRLADRHAAHRAGYRVRPTPRPMASGLELSARRRDGTEFPAEISLAPVGSRRGPLVFTTVADITARTNLQDQLEQANEELRHHADELEQRGREMALLAQMGELLESCQSLDEAYGVIARMAEPLFAGDAGAVYALASSGSAVEAVAAWGSPPPTRSVFSPTDCWALRRGRLHVVHDGDPELKCSHVEEPIGSGLLCDRSSPRPRRSGCSTSRCAAGRQARRERPCSRIGDASSRRLAGSWRLRSATSASGRRSGNSQRAIR